MKKLLALVLLFASKSALAAIVYACACGTGAHGSCVPGSPPGDATDGTTPAKAWNTVAQWRTAALALTAGSQILMCQGGAWDNWSQAQWSTPYGTNKASPIIWGTYDDTARWVGGAGIRPKLNAAAGAIVMFNLLAGSQRHSEGLIIRGIELIGTANVGSYGIRVGADRDYLTIDDMKITGFGLATQFASSGSAGLTGEDTISDHITIKNSILSSNLGAGVLIAANDVLIENNTMDSNGTTGQDHHIYLTGGVYTITPVTISSITGDGVTATLTTATAHNIPTGHRFTINVSGTTSAGSGSFNATGGIGASAVIGTVTGATTITYAATGTPSASVVGVYLPTVSYAEERVTIRNNTLTNADILGAGNCDEAALVVHGHVKGLLIENNMIREDSVPVGTSCIGIEVSDGGYFKPEDYNEFDNVVIRGNTIINYGTGISLDLCAQCLVENNYVYSTWTTETFGIRMRGKNFTPSSGANVIPTGAQSPHNVTIRHNTVYLTAPASTSWGIALNGNVADPLTGSNHSLYGNAVVLGGSPAATTMCFNTENMTLSMFTVKDHNACYYVGATVPKWENTSSLATIQAVGSTNKSDINSLMARSASDDPTIGQPIFTAPTTSPAVTTASALKNAGRSIGPNTAWGKARRNQGVRDIGAFEFGATLGVVPNSPTP